MSPSLPDSETSGSEERFDLLADSFVERVSRGENPSVEEYARDYPDLAGRIRTFFPTLRYFAEARAAGSVPASPEGGGCPSETTVLPGRIGEYRIVRELGRGGMGIVYEAVQESLGRRVALKLLPSWARMDARRLERFRQEARAAAALQHPNIVQVHGIGEEGGIPYYVMQYVPGAGLDRILLELRRIRGFAGSPAMPSGGMSPTLASSSACDLLGAGSGGSHFAYFENVARLGIQAADALACAHAQGILHRDVKPSNFLLDSSGRILIADFGLAKSEGSEDLTGSGEVVGTPRYMAPERLRGWSDPRSDIYGLGLTLYELLALRPAFDDPDPGQLLRKIAEAEPVRLRRIDARIPRDLEVIVLKCIAREPAERYASAADLAEDLRRFLRGDTILAHPTGALGRSVKWVRRKPAVACLLAVIAISLASFFVLTLRHGARLRIENEKARANLLDALDAVKRMLVRFGGEDLARSPEGESLRRSLLDEALEFHRRFLERSPDDPPVLLEAARVQRRMAEIQAKAGLLVEARESLERAVGTLRSRAAREEESGEIGKELEFLEEQIRFLREGGRPATGSLVDRFFISRGTNVVDTAAIDVDSDGRKELIAVNKGTSSVTILRAQGTREFQAVAEYPLGMTPYQKALGDFDGEKGPDLAAYGVDMVPFVSVILNRGNGTFEPPVLISPQARIWAMVAGDLDGDRRDELALVANGLQIIDRSSEGELVLGEEIRIPPNPNSLASGDFDRDGNLDLAVGCYPNRKGLLWVRWGDGRGGATEVSEIPVPILPVEGLSADLDGDGDLDIAFVDRSTSSFAIAWNKGNRSFQVAEAVNLPQISIPIAAGDFDGDGDQDMAITSEMEGRVTILVNDGGRRLSPGRPFLSGGRAFHGWGGDVDGDGQVDLAIANGNNDDVAVMFRLREHLAAGGEFPEGTSAGASVPIPDSPSGDLVIQFTVGQGAEPVDAAAADLEGDGKPELIAANRGTRSIGVLRARGSREYYTVSTLPLGLEPSRIAIGDLDGRGGPDLIAFGPSESRISALLGEGGGSFGPPAVFLLAIAPRSFAVADLDGDGRDEAAVVGDRLQIADCGEDGKLLLGDSIGVPPSAFSLLAADLDRDGSLDLAAGCAGEPAGLLWIRWGIAPGNGSPGGASGASKFPFPIVPLQGLASDLDGDGDVDLVFEDERTERVAIAWNESQRSLRAGEAFPLPRTVLPFAAADLDGDGDVDLAFTGGVAEAVPFLLNDGRGKLFPGRPLITGGQAWRGCARDLDGDGEVDLAVANGRWDTLAVIFRLREHLRGMGGGAMAEEKAGK